MGTLDIVIASMQLCVRCIAIAAPNGRAQSYKFHVAGVTTCPVRPRADKVDPLVISLAETAAIRCDQQDRRVSQFLFVAFQLFCFSLSLLYCSPGFPILAQCNPCGGKESFAQLRRSRRCSEKSSAWGRACLLRRCGQCESFVPADECRHHSVFDPSHLADRMSGSETDAS